MKGKARMTDDRCQVMAKFTWIFGQGELKTPITQYLPGRNHKSTFVPLNEIYLHYNIWK